MTMAQYSNTQKVVKGISTQTLVTIVTGVAEIFYFSIMSRLLTREEFGIFAAISAVTIIFSSVSDAGIGSALIQRKEMTDDYKNTAFTLSVILGGGVALIMAALSGVLARLVVGAELHVPLLLMSSCVFIHGMLSVNFSWMRRHLHFLKAGMINLVAIIISSIIAISLAMRGYGFYAIMFKAIVGSLLTLVISYFYVETRFRFLMKREHVKSILNFGGWLTASVIISNISSQLDRLLMSRLLSVEALGAYNRPKEFILQIGTRINGIFDTALFPILSGIQDKRGSLVNAFNRSQYFLNIASMLLALSFICNADLLIRIFFGKEWLDLRLIFQLLALNLIFNINGRLGDCYLRSLGLVRQQFNLRVLEFVLSVIGILCGYYFGITGIAIGFTLSNAVLIGVKTIYLAKRLEIKFVDVVKQVFGGWFYGFYYLPIIVIQYSIFSNTLLTNIISLIIFIILTVVVFLLLPQMIGNQYKVEVHQKVRDVILNGLQTKKMK